MIKVMDARTGFVQFRSYTANSRKGVRNADGTFSDRMNLASDAQIYTADGRDVLRGTFANGKPQSEFTSKVVELKVTSATSVALRWAPVLPGTILLDDGTNYIVDDGNGGLVSHVKANVDMEKVSVGGRVSYTFYQKGTTTVDTGTEVQGATVNYGSTRDVHGNDANVDTVRGYAGSITGLTSGNYEVSYCYENEYVPKHSWGDNGIKLAA